MAPGIQHLREGKWSAARATTFYGPRIRRKSARGLPDMVDWVLKSSTCGALNCLHYIDRAAVLSGSRFIGGREGDLRGRCEWVERPVSQAPVRTLNRSGRGKGMFTAKPLRDERNDDVLSAAYVRRTEDALGF